MRMELISGCPPGCAGGTCPAVYRTDRGTFVVQGSVLNSAEVVKLSVPPNESVVEIPERLLIDLAEKLSASR